MRFFPQNTFFMNVLKNPYVAGKETEILNPLTLQMS